MSASRPTPAFCGGSPFFFTAALALAAVIPALGFPVYFRTDDVHWLGWALDHANPLAAFVPRENLFGYYRPLPTLAWWLMARLFGFDPLGYQLVLAGVSVLAMVPLYRIGRRLVGAEWGGLAAVGLYHALNFTILYYVFWYSALTFGLELLLLLLAFDALLDGEGRPARPVLFVVWSLLAGLAKQPALLILPLVGGGLILQGSGDRRRRLAWFFLLGAVSLVLLLMTPFVAHRPDALSAMPTADRTEFLRERFDFYARVLMRGPAGPLVALAAAIGLLTPRASGGRPAVSLASVAGGLAFAALVRFLPPPVGCGVWLVLILGAALRAPATRPWVAGFFVPSLLLLGVDFHVATYLLEPLLCLAPAALLWLCPLLEPAGRGLTLFLRRVPGAAALLVPLVFTASATAVLRDRVTPLVVMRDVRAAFRAGVDLIVAQAPQGTTVGCLTYDELGRTYADIRRRPLGERVEAHKTMNPVQLEKFFRLRGRGDLRVLPVAEAVRALGPVYLLALNAEEDEILQRVPLAKPLARYAGGRGVSVVYFVARQ